MAYLKRGADGVVLVNADGTRHPLEVGA
jgi:hypothetical protein